LWAAWLGHAKATMMAIIIGTTTKMRGMTALIATNIATNQSIGRKHLSG